MAKENSLLNRSFRICRAHFEDIFIQGCLHQEAIRALNMFQVPVSQPICNDVGTQTNYIE